MLNVLAYLNLGKSDFWFDTPQENVSKIKVVSQTLVYFGFLGKYLETFLE